MKTERQKYSSDQCSTAAAGIRGLKLQARKEVAQKTTDTKLN